MDINSTCLNGCSPTQIVTLTYALNNINDITIHGKCNDFDNNNLQFSYSLDNICWSCYMSYDEFMTNIIGLSSDFFIRFKINDSICGITIDNEKISDYDVQLDSGFNLQDTLSNSLYNPYSNLDQVLQLQQQLSDNVVSMFGIACYYFKLKPEETSKDLTFKEYTLMNVDSVKQIKIVIQDGTMPSSKPEFTDFGLDWQNDWEVEISKIMFATAFGNTAQPMEGDLVYIPMMKRMWMVNGAYEEKNGNLMWQATTFKLVLVKYQEKGSVDLNTTEELVNSFVKNKYEDLFGEDNNSTYDSGEASTNNPTYAAYNLYPVFESDATRKYMTCDSIKIIPNNVYYRGTLISDYQYMFINQAKQSKIIYQNKYCGEEYSISFIIYPNISVFEGTILEIGHVKINIKQSGMNSTLYININENMKVDLKNNSIYFVVVRFSKCMNISDMFAYNYTYNKNIPQYKLNNNHYYFDIDRPQSKYISKFDVEYIISEKSDICLYNFDGNISNIKIFDMYNDNISELLQMYPTNQHLMINDTARKLIDISGVSPK